MSSADTLPCSSMSFPYQQQQQSASSSPQHQHQQHQNHKVSRKSSTKSYDTKAVSNTVALAVIAQLQHWCYQLFWLTIVCVMGCCGDLQAISNKNKTLQDVRKTIATVSAQNSIKRSKSVLELEMQLLRHLTSPQTAILRPVHSKPLKKRQLSRPPSPQLFDISEDDEY
jgi:hypothetical protein